MPTSPASPASRPATVLLDVRTPGEFEHIPGALNVPLDARDESETALPRPEDGPVVLAPSGEVRRLGAVPGRDGAQQDGARTSPL